MGGWDGKSSNRPGPAELPPRVTSTGRSASGFRVFPSSRTSRPSPVLTPPVRSGSPGRDLRYGRGRASRPRSGPLRSRKDRNALLGEPVRIATPRWCLPPALANVTASSASWVRAGFARSPPRPRETRCRCKAATPARFRGVPRRSWEPPGYPSRTSILLCRRVTASRILPSVSIRIGPRVSGKNRIPRRRSSRSHSRKGGADRSYKVARPKGARAGRRSRRARAERGRRGSGPGRRRRRRTPSSGPPRAGRRRRSPAPGSRRGRPEDQTNGIPGPFRSLRTRSRGHRGLPGGRPPGHRATERSPRPREPWTRGRGRNPPSAAPPGRYVAGRVRRRGPGQRDRG